MDLYSRPFPLLDHRMLLLFSLRVQFGLWSLWGLHSVFCVSVSQLFFSVGVAIFRVSFLFPYFIMANRLIFHTLYLKNLKLLSSTLVIAWIITSLFSWLTFPALRHLLHTSAGFLACTVQHRIPQSTEVCNKSSLPMGCRICFTMMMMSHLWY